jgi:ADP-ribose pyrophosphatase YjhB (NUDIX family)
VVLHHRSEGAEVLDTELVLVREFRSPARTSDGFVHELPGGSSVQEGMDAAQVAAKEVEEETSLVLPPERFVAVGSRQVAGTLSTHHARIYAAALTDEEMKSARALATARAVHGEASETERTIVEITTLREMLAGQLVDWSTMGMVCQALLQRG